MKPSACNLALIAALFVSPALAQTKADGPAKAPVRRFDAAAEFGQTNPSGVWSYGKGTMGGEFEAFPTFKTDKVQWWIGASPWQSVYKNHGAAEQHLSKGLDPKPGDLVMHPGNGKDHLTIIRFTAPADGRYAVDAKWVNIDVQAKKTWSWVHTNAVSAKGTTYPGAPAGFKELHTVGLSGLGGAASFKQEVDLTKGEILSFEVGNGGDTFSNDSVKAEIVVTQLPSAPASGKFPGIYRLKTQFRGDGECLEGNQASSPVKGGAAFMDKCQAVSGQLWKIEDAGNGFYRLKTKFRGDGESLEGNQASSSVKSGAAFMDKAQGVSGQLWKLEDAGKGYYRLKTQFRGEGECLEGNQASSSVKGGAAFMDKCQAVSGQLWKLEKVD